MTRPRAVTTAPRSFKAARILYAARTARSACSSPSKNKNERVAAELDQITAFGSGYSQERVERVVENERELLSTRPSELGELLGESSEA